MSLHVDVRINDAALWQITASNISGHQGPGEVAYEVTAVSGAGEHLDLGAVLHRRDLGAVPLVGRMVAALWVHTATDEQRALENEHHLDLARRVLRGDE